MNNFFIFDNKPFMFQQNNMICPVKPIICSSNINNINNTSEITSVLQCLANLKCINIWINQLSMNGQLMNNKKITYEIFILFSSLYKGQIPDSSNFILNFINKLELNNNNNQNKHDPYHFLFNLLMILHIENNYPRNPNYNFNNLKGKNNKDKNITRKIFDDYLYQVENSIISNNFYIRLGHMFDCSCGKSYKDTYKYMIKFEIEKYKKFRDQCNAARANNNINMEECFDCYTGGSSKQCKGCGSFKNKEFLSLYSTSNVLIISLSREKHVFKSDFDFSFQISLNNYYERGVYMSNNFYILKSCISLNNKGIFFSYVNINNQWWRFCGNSSVYIGNIVHDIYQYEPQLLIYELKN